MYILERINESVNDNIIEKINDVLTISVVEFSAKLVKILFKNVASNKFLRKKQ
tara:strand:- start:179 stop:337 length:159 start_codon:yes stop_codon:yes gene_type:complete